MTMNKGVEAAQVRKPLLGRLLLEKGLISEEELDQALAEQSGTDKRLGEILVECGYISGPEMKAAVMEQLGADMSMQEGFGFGLWGEIQRRHPRARRREQDGRSALGAAPSQAEGRAETIAFGGFDRASRMDEQLEQLREALAREVAAREAAEQQLRRARKTIATLKRRAAGPTTS